MNSNTSEELLLLKIKVTVTYAEGTKATSQETLEIELYRSKQVLSFIMPLDLGEDKWMNGLTK